MLIALWPQTWSRQQRSNATLVAALVLMVLALSLLGQVLSFLPEPIGSNAQAFSDGARTTLWLTLVSGAVGLVLGTVAGSWLLLPIEFALAYASLFHSGPRAPHGLEFPGDRADQGRPDYLDFLYFAITLAATSQTSDVTVSARPMRRLVLVQALLSFVFNTVVLALSINLLAGLAA